MSSFKAIATVLVAAGISFFVHHWIVGKNLFLEAEQFSSAQHLSTKIDNLNASIRSFDSFKTKSVDSLLEISGRLICGTEHCLTYHNVYNNGVFAAISAAHVAAPWNIPVFYCPGLDVAVFLPSELCNSSTTHFLNISAIPKQHPAGNDVTCAGYYRGVPQAWFGTLIGFQVVRDAAKMKKMRHNDPVDFFVTTGELKAQGNQMHTLSGSGVLSKEG